MYYILGLGNPGEEYKHTRHNVGRDIVEILRKKLNFPEFEFDKKHSGLLSTGEAYGEKVFLILPDTFMNKSGNALKYIIFTEKKAEKLIIVRDDLDLPIGKIRIHFKRSSGGHRGVESIIKTIRTESFIQVKVGIAPITPSGKIKKPSSEKILDFIVGKFKKTEEEIINLSKEHAVNALKTILESGKQKAMGDFNT